ncbi:hypothetical protein N9164_08415 [Draconibacterium sp.]|nr:hypothetical protein [Draconibacterium sp.]
MKTITKFLTGLILLANLLISCTVTQEKNKIPISISKGDLQAVFINNEAYGQHHKAGYNGISELRHTDQDSNLFVPSYAGFNLEHIFAGDSLSNLFEPRKVPMEIKRISKNSVELYQAETPLSHVESWTTFKMVPPHYIDVNFRCVIKSGEFFKHGYVGIFWASYINGPQDKKIHFSGLVEGNDEVKWIRASTPKHGVESTHIGVDDKFVLFAVPGFNVTLANHYSNYRFIEPFYYGRFDNMVFAYLFSESKDGIIRFSQSPTGGGQGNPAWDFQFIIPEFEIGKEYSFNSRLVYKVWEGAEDIREEYKKWQ